MTKNLTHTRMIIIRIMVKHTVSILLVSSPAWAGQASDLFNKIINWWTEPWQKFWHTHGWLYGELHL